MTSNSAAAHRGRIQSQGGGIEDSENWSQSLPLPAKDAKAKTWSLHRRHSRTEKVLRKPAFQKAEKFIADAQKNGGASAPISKSYPVKNDAHRRVDIEVRKGEAFK